jgi:pilus assembly protein CpaD
MLKRINRIAAAHAGTALALCAGLALSGCKIQDAVTEDYYEPVAHYDRYPIKVEKTPVKLDLASKSGTLRPAQINALVSLAQQAKSNAASQIYVKRPSGGGRSVAVANDITALLMQQGIPRAMIVPASYRGASTSPVQVSYVRSVAVTKECGDWSSNLSEIPGNGSYSNFGCATQQNVAAMVANPEDFLVPRAMDPAYAVTRTGEIQTFETAKNAGENVWTINVNTDE